MSEARSSVVESADPTAGRDRLRTIDPYLVAFMLAIAITRVASTYPIFNHTFDEPVHVAMGLQWLDQGRYEGLYQTPPLGRVVLALGPWLAGMRYPTIEGSMREVPVLRSGLTILYRNGPYLRTLTLARVGNLLFLALATIAVWRLGLVCFGRLGGLVATLVFTSTPVVLGHAGVATTDLAVTAGIAWVVLAQLHALRKGTWLAACVLAVSIGLSILTKLTFFLFGVAAMLAVLGCWLLARRRGFDVQGNVKRLATRVAVSSAVIVPLTIWAGYRFATWSPQQVMRGAGTEPLILLAGMFDRLGLQIPAPQFFLALDVIARLNEAAVYPSYVLGHVDPSGFFYYYPVIIAFKTPLAITALVIGSLFFVRKNWTSGTWMRTIPIVIVIAMLIVGTFIRTNAGIRYIIPILVFMALAAGGAVVDLRALLGGRTGTAFAATAVATILVPAALCHPDYLAYFNVLAGKHPEKISIDSDLDWGQDLLRLRDEVEARGLERLSLLYFGSALPDEHGFTAELALIRPDERVSGWLAVSRMRRAGILSGDEAIHWLDDYEPVATIGRSILLYDVPAR